MNRMKKVIAVALSTVTITGIAVGSGSISVGASGTGAGLAEYALNAYYEGWSYVWGGTSPGAVDCSGLIWSYCGGDRMEMLADAQANGRDWGYVSNGILRVHGLGLSRPNHVGVYIEDGMEVDARGSDYGVCYQKIGENGWNNWNCWFKLTAVSYPENGWENFNGNYYYYENGEYIVNTSRTIDGTTYYFDSKGHSGTTPSNTTATSSSGSSSSGTSKPTMWSKGSKDDEVKKIQERLAELGYYDGPIDGDFGDMTEAAFKAFQQNAGLTVDGIAGADREVLYSDSAPAAKKDKEETPTVSAEEPTEAEPEETEPAATEPEETEPEETEPEEADPEQTQQEDSDSDTVGSVDNENDEDEDNDNVVQNDETDNDSAPVIVAENGDFSDQVSKIQSQLAELGFYEMETTGYFGEFTEEAVKEFQMANGIDATGKVDAKTFEKLFSDDAIKNVLTEVTEVIEDEIEEPKAASVAAAEVEPVAAPEAAPAEDTVIVIQADVPEEVETEVELPAQEEQPIVLFEASDDAPAIVAAEPTKPGSISAGNGAADNNAANKGSVTKPNKSYASDASKKAAKANTATAKTLENSAASTASKTVSVKNFASMWMWLLLAAAVLGVVAFILLMYSRKQMSAPASKKTSKKSDLNDRW